MDIKKDCGLDFIFDRLIPSGYYGKNYLKNLNLFTLEEEDQLKEEYFYLNNISKYASLSTISTKVIREVISDIKNIKGSVLRLKNGEYLCDIELYEIKNFNLSLKKLDNILNKYSWNNYSKNKFEISKELQKILDPNETLSSSFTIYSEYSNELKNIRNDIDKKMQEEKNRLLILAKKIEKKYNISIKHFNQIIIDKNNIELNEKFLLDNSIVYQSEDYLKKRYKVSDEKTEKYIRELNILKAKEIEEEDRVLKKISKELLIYIDFLERQIEILEKFDFRIAKAIFSNSFDCVKPDIISENKIKIVNGRHLKTENIVGKDNFTAINIELNNGVTCITGANMGGKTVNLKLIAQCTLLAQFGLFVPAEKFEFSLREFVEISSGDSQSVETGLSTFGSEIVNMKSSIARSNERGLILIDELARGTNPLEGTAISKAIVNYLKTKNSISVITTHFEGVGHIKEVKQLQVAGLNKEKLKDLFTSNYTNKTLRKLQEIMDYHLIEIDDDVSIPKDAIEIAKLLGLDNDILIDALRYLKEER
ncbi:lysine 5,6-aminomutase reactivase ATPase KamC [Helicovermis profundi]|uniref:Endonuclease MutS2 n=1 Tax=Helicovermis profundi TaxID=3065157 RepID=A0AAU9EKK5_9FIRM|nr:endonuclease MutS2 [Clostridia bacterium S502]